MKATKELDRNFVVGHKWKNKYFSSTDAPKEGIMPSSRDGTMFKTRDEAMYYFNRLPISIRENYEVRPAYSRPSKMIK